MVPDSGVPRDLGPIAALLPDVREAIGWAADELRSAGISTSRVDAELLLAHVLDIERGELLRLALLRAPVWQDSDQAARFAEIVSQRAMRLPLQHLTGHAPFRHLELYVGTGVFVPRPETEIVAQVAIDELALRGELASRVVPISDEAAAVTPISPLRGVDLCAGSGAIALAMATEVPNAEVWGVELSREAFEYTRRNNAKYGDAVTFIRGDARTALHELDGTVDVVVSNPPYVPPGAVPRDREVAEHDPHIALFGLGPDGLEVPRGITDAAARLLKAGGLYVMEHAEVQDAAVRDMVSASTYFERVETRLDLTGRPRMVVAFRNDVAYVEGTVK